MEESNKVTSVTAEKTTKLTKGGGDQEAGDGYGGGPGYSWD
jgi:hypothetical protein